MPNDTAEEKEAMAIQRAAERGGTKSVAGAVKNLRAAGLAA